MSRILQRNGFAVGNTFPGHKEYINRSVFKKGLAAAFFLVFLVAMSGRLMGPLSSHGIAETEEQNRIRFQVELEFVQCLANPNYIHFLAQRGYLKEQTFVNYLKYLQYWREPEYARFLKYPMSLHFLELLQHEAFRRECVSAQVCKFMDDQAILLWQHYTRRRTRTLQPPDAPAPPAPPAPPHHAPQRHQP